MTARFPMLDRVKWEREGAGKAVARSQITGQRADHGVGSAEAAEDTG